MADHDNVIPLDGYIAKLGLPRRCEVIYQGRTYYGVDEGDSLTAFIHKEDADRFYKEVTEDFLTDCETEGPNQ